MAGNWGFAFGLVVSAVLIALAALVALTAAHARLRPNSASIFRQDTPGTVLIFDGEALVDASPSARGLVANALESGGPWFRALSRLEPMFPGLTRRLDGLHSEGSFVLSCREDVEPPVLLRAELLGGLTRLTLIDDQTQGRTRPSDGAADLALRDEVALLRDTTNRAPLPIWREGAEGVVVWANAAYLDLATARLEPGQEIGWPLPELFPQPPAGAVRQRGPASRRQLVQDGQVRWYDVTVMPAGEDRLHFAQPADRLVQAETQLNEFMQTLTKTFAHLPIGLAIFDRKRVLQLFNPALIDLTGLSAEFLIGRPTLSTLLDAMRETSMIPEPRDYRTWRRQIVDLEEAAASGLFEETWTLPSGQTYRVTGRPHPNGALAFQFEDISGEMMRTRRFRAELELGQAVIDAMDEAVTVFAQDGTRLMGNRQAEALWGARQAGEVESIQTEIAQWKDRAAPTLLWNDLADYVGSLGSRDPWDGEVRLRDGRLLTCRVAPMPQGATLVAFRLARRDDEAQVSGLPVAAVMVA